MKGITFNFYLFYKKLLNKVNKNGRPLINPDGCTFFLTATGPDEVQKLIEKLDTSKSTGPFGLPIFLLKAFKEFFSIWLSELINLCFEMGEFPTVLKNAKVTPVHKKVFLTSEKPGAGNFLIKC